jgi:hypothetical protein
MAVNRRITYIKAGRDEDKKWTIPSKTPGTSYNVSVSEEGGRANM